MFICCIEEYRSDCHAGKDDATLMQNRSWQIACFNDYQILLLCLLCRALWLFSAAPSEPAADPTFIPQLKSFSPEFCTSWHNFSSQKLFCWPGYMDYSRYMSSIGNAVSRNFLQNRWKALLKKSIILDLLINTLYIIFNFEQICLSTWISFFKMKESLFTRMLRLHNEQKSC